MGFIVIEKGAKRENLTKTAKSMNHKSRSMLNIDGGFKFYCTCIHSPKITARLVVVLGFNRFLGHYFHMYRAGSQREGVTKEIGEMRLKLAKKSSSHTFCKHGRTVSY